MIGGLQGEFGDLDIKYLKQNILKSRSEISGSFRRTPRHCILRERNSPGKRYQRIRTCLTGEVETSSFPIRHQVPDVKYPEKVECRPDRIPDVRYPEKGGKSAGWYFGCKISGEGGTSQGGPSACARCRDPSP